NRPASSTASANSAAAHRSAATRSRRVRFRSTGTDRTTAGLPRHRGRYGEEGGAVGAVFFLREPGAGLTRTTTHVTPAASAIMHAMKTTIPSSPSTLATEVG